MIKNEYEFTFMVGEPTIGEGIVLKLKDGRIVRTSRVVDFMIWRTGDIVPTARSLCGFYESQTVAALPSRIGIAKVSPASPSRYTTAIKANGTTDDTVMLATLKLICAVCSKNTERFA